MKCHVILPSSYVKDIRQTDWGPHIFKLLDLNKEEDRVLYLDNYRFGSEMEFAAQIAAMLESGVVDDNEDVILCPTPSQFGHGQAVMIALLLSGRHCRIVRRTHEGKLNLLMRSPAKSILVAKSEGSWWDRLFGK